MNRLILMALVLFIAVIWFSSLANACTPRGLAGGFFGPSWGAPIFIGGGGWDRGGSSTPSSPLPSRSSGGSATRGGGISVGKGGK